MSKAALKEKYTNTFATALLKHRQDKGREKRKKCYKGNCKVLTQTRKQERQLQSFNANTETRKAIANFFALNANAKIITIITIVNQINNCKRKKRFCQG